MAKTKSGSVAERTELESHVLKAAGGKGLASGTRKAKGTGEGNEDARNPIMPKRLSGVPVALGGRRLCFGLNLGDCTASSPGEKCSRGWHLCTNSGCHRPHAATGGECNVTSKTSDVHVTKADSHKFSHLPCAVICLVFCSTDARVQLNWTKLAWNMRLANLWRMRASFRTTSIPSATSRRLIGKIRQHVCTGSVDDHPRQRHRLRSRSSGSKAVRGPPVEPGGHQEGQLSIARGNARLSRTDWHNPLEVGETAPGKKSFAEFASCLNEKQELRRHLSFAFLEGCCDVTAQRTQCHFDTIISANHEQHPGRRTQSSNAALTIAKICCATAEISRACEGTGSHTVAFDWHNNKFKPCHGVGKLDLRGAEAQTRVFEQLEDHNVQCVWMAPP